MTEFQGKTLPDITTVNEMTRRIFSGDTKHDGVCPYRMIETTKRPAQTVHYVARHKDVLPLLSDQNSLMSLSHYDEIMGALKGGLAFQVGENDQQKERWEILGAAFDISPPIRRDSLPGIEIMADRAVDRLIETFKSRSHPTFNAVREFGFVVPYLVGIDLTGLQAPKKPGLLLKLFTWFRNRRDDWGRKRRPSDKLKLRGDILGGNQLLLWAHLMFGHAFANFGLRNPFITFAASSVAKRFAAHAKKSMDAPHIAPDMPLGDNLVVRFAQVKPAFVANGRMSSEDYDRNVRCLLVEVMGSLQILIGNSFANIMGLIYDKDMGLREVADILNDPDGKDFLDEAMRLKPTTPSVYRVAKDDIDHLGVKKEDGVCLLTEAAGMDATVFDDPYHLAVPNSEGPHRTHTDYLNFGPNERQVYHLENDGTRSVDPGVAHPCFGQHWARAVLKTMITSLAKDHDGFHNLRPDEDPFSGVLKFAAIPDSLIMRFDKTRKPDTEQDHGP